MNRDCQSDRPRERGYTMVEIVISASVTMTLFAAAYSVLYSGMGAYSTEVTLASVEKQANAAVDRIAQELVRAGQGVISPSPSANVSTSVISYQHNMGYSSGVTTWGPTRRIILRADPDDPDDGKDNNGNGLIDEKIVVLIVNPGDLNQTTTVLTRWVSKYLEGETGDGLDENGNGLTDEAGLSMSLVGGVWTIRLTVEMPTADGTILTRTVETSVMPRNS